MKQKIKTWLIHWLGGMTKEEISIAVEFGRQTAPRITDHKAFQKGIASALEAVKRFADVHYGEDWRASIYQFVEDGIRKSKDEETTTSHINTLQKKDTKVIVNIGK